MQSHAEKSTPVTPKEKEAVQKGSGSDRHYDATEHNLSLAELKQELKTDLNEETPQNSNGLPEKEAMARLLQNGPNAMTPPKKTPEIIKFLMQFTNMFMLLLMLASALSFIAYELDQSVKVNLYCGIALCVIVVGQCTASYLEERKSNSVMDSLKKMMPAQCSAIRDGKPRRIPAAELVVGDLVQLKGGDKVPADLRIIQTSGLKVECSSLTGEPDAFEVTVMATHQEPHETRNLVFSTSQCTEGSAFGVVIRTANRTLIGMVASLATSTATSTSTLQLEITRVVKLITVFALLMALCILAVGTAQKMDMIVVANLVITIFVANIPQGLPATVTSCLGVAAKRMQVRNVLVKNLDVIETLGSATCICSDKTGTLTQNKMSVQNFWFNGSFEMLHGGVMIGAASRMQSIAEDFPRRIVSGQSVASDFPKRILSGQSELRSDFPKRITSGQSVRSSASAMSMVRWRGNPLEPLLLVAAVCNSARFAAKKDEEEKDARKAVAPVAGSASVPKAGNDVPIGKASLALPTALPTRHLTGLLDRQSHAVPGRSLVLSAKPVTGEILGDASESALLRYCESIYPVDKIREMYPRVYDEPFNSTNKYALCIVNPPEGECPGKQYVLLKGAPEVVLARCNAWLCAGVEKPLDDDFQRQFQDAYERFANAGERVLGFARKVVTSQPVSELTSSSVPREGFVFMGLASLMDPPKVGVDKAIEECRAAGIRVFMVTGDHALTAEAIAHKVNIITLPTRMDLAHDRGVPVEEVDPHDPEIQAIVITGHELRDFTLPDWEHLLDFEEIVFARTTPQQKLEIVEHLQRRGEVVAVTGDGVNDAPALKKANIGVAMGNPNASDVAREAADIIILDDDFCSIVSAIREGRLLFDNLKKSIAYTLTHLVPEMVPVLLNIILLFPLGLAPMLILTIDLGSELVPAISLAYEEPEAAIMQRPPRNIKTDRLVTWPLLFYAYGVAGTMMAVFSILSFFCVFWSEGIALADLLLPEQTYFVQDAPTFFSGGRAFTAAEQMDILSTANAAVYASIILCQMWHIWFCRTRSTSVTKHPIFSNKLVLLSMPWELAFIIIFCFVPQLKPVFISGSGLPFEFWLLSLGFLVFIAVYSETVKFFSRAAIQKGSKSFIARLAW